MKLQFKHQKFQADAAKAVVDVFAGQPYLTPTYMMDRGLEDGEQQAIATMDDFAGWRNERIVPELSDSLTKLGDDMGLSVHVMHEDIFNSMHRI